MTNQIFEDHKGQRIFRSYADTGKIEEILASPMDTSFLIGPNEYLRMLEHLIQEAYDDNFSVLIQEVPFKREDYIRMINALLTGEVVENE